MKIKVLIYTSIALLIATFTACDDDLNTTGNSIRPGLDDIIVMVDTVTGIKAATVSMDSVYARTTYGLIGEYVDPIFGSIKSDYLCELYCPDTMQFFGAENNHPVTIDSVQFSIMFSSFWGDSISPMGVSVYEVNNPLERNYYTNIDPTKYCSMDKPLGQGVFSIQNIPFPVGTDGKINSSMRSITTPLSLKTGEFFLEKWRSNPESFYNSDSLKTFFPGLYVTTNLGSGTLVNVDYSMFDIYYSYDGKNKEGTEDSTYIELFRLTVTPEVIQLNRVENKTKDLVGPSNGKSYIKSPAGLCTELTIPLSEIVEKSGSYKVINSAKFSLPGITEEEAEAGFPRPTSLLLIHKDSVETFFRNKSKPDGLTTKVVTNTEATNLYDMGNIASLVNHYVDYYKEQGMSAADMPDMKFRLIPVDVTYTTSSSGTSTIDRTYNTMTPRSAILRTDESTLKMPLIVSRYNTEYNE